MQLTVATDSLILQKNSWYVGYFKIVLIQQFQLDWSNLNDEFLSSEYLSVLVDFKMNTCVQLRLEINNINIAKVSLYYCRQTFFKKQPTHTPP